MFNVVNSSKNCTKIKMWKVKMDKKKVCLPFSELLKAFLYICFFFYKQHSLPQASKPFNIWRKLQVFRTNKIWVSKFESHIRVYSFKVFTQKFIFICSSLIFSPNHCASFSWRNTQVCTCSTLYSNLRPTGLPSSLFNWTFGK